MSIFQNQPFQKTQKSISKKFLFFKYHYNVQILSKNLFKNPKTLTVFQKYDIFFLQKSPLKKKKKKNSSIFQKYSYNGVFWVNIAKFELYLHYRNCWKLFRIVRKESEFRYHHCPNSTKSMRKKKKKGERENVEFR